MANGLRLCWTASVKFHSEGIGRNSFVGETTLRQFSSEASTVLLVGTKLLLRPISDSVVQCHTETLSIFL